MTTPEATASPDVAAAIGLLMDARRVAVVCHKDPDGDAVGALLGLGQALRSLGKQVTMMCEDPVPGNLSFLPGSDQVVDAAPDGCDLVVVVDCSDERRLGKLGAPISALNAPLVNIDHHVTNTRFGQVNVVDPQTVSATEIVYRLLEAMEYALDPDVATCLLTGLVTDTLGFRTANVTQGVLLTAARLMDAGAPLATITELALDRRSYPALRAIGKALEKVQFEDGVIWSAMTLEDARAVDPSGAGARPRYFSNILNTVEGAGVAAFFSEMPEGRIDVSMRAKPGFDLSVLFDAGSVLHGQGGGHPLASGAEVDTSLDETVARVVDALKALVEAQSPEPRA